PNPRTRNQTRLERPKPKAFQHGPIVSGQLRPCRHYLPNPLISCVLSKPVGQDTCPDDSVIASAFNGRLSISIKPSPTIQEQDNHE
ncbi:MAG TPA: hypothetical protein PK710_24130, partial [Polyangiaceae bacterium]|nr:hypothetical protein [Polyangiaceae bacterium]